MRYKKQILVVLLFAALVTLAQCRKSKDVEENSNPAVIYEGKQIFRFDTFGDEDFWSGVLHVDKAIAGAANGGFGGGVSPRTALAVGLKVDADALPADVVAGIQSGAINLDDQQMNFQNLTKYLQTRLLLFFSAKPYLTIY